MHTESFSKTTQIYEVCFIQEIMRYASVKKKKKKKLKCDRNKSNFFSQQQNTDFIQFNIYVILFAIQY